MSIRDVALNNPGMELVGCTMVIQNELDQGLLLGDIALTYALAIRSESVGADTPDWKVINEAIAARFGKKGLEQVKKLAWKRFERVAS